MPESSVHLLLVQELVNWVKANRRATEGLLLVDEPSRTSLDKPPQIAGYNPDLFWRNVAGSSVVIGEAKPAYDVESRHSRKQLAAFLSHLTKVNEGVLLLAVPWHAAPQARSLVRAIQREIRVASAKVVVLDLLPG